MPCKIAEIMNQFLVMVVSKVKARLRGGKQSTFKFVYCLHQGYPNYFDHETAIQLFYLYRTDCATYMHAYRCVTCAITDLDGAGDYE